MCGSVQKREQILLFQRIAPVNEMQEARRWKRARETVCVSEREPFKKRNDADDEKEDEERECEAKKTAGKTNDNAV